MFKVLTAGDGGVGKTTLLYRYVNGIFLEDTSITLGVNFFLKELNTYGLNIILQLWDFGGQDRFKSLHNLYTKGAKGAILMYDLSRLSTLNNIEYWVNLCRNDNPNLPILFVGTKSDIVDGLYDEKDMIDLITEKFNFCDYFRVSSKTGENVEKVFEVLSKNILIKLWG
ncbi:MAG: Rab family GTPase [Promethearchaeota archaeon]